MPTVRFERFIGIDYSGAEVANASLKGLRVYAAEGDGEPVEVPPPPSPRKYWSRKEIAEWLVEQCRDSVPVLVGIDHAFSFPREYFERYGIEKDWAAFLEDFSAHWPTDEPNVYVDFVRDGNVGLGWKRTGSSKWRRAVEQRAGAKSVFHFDVPGSVAKSTHAGLPWLYFLRQRLGPKLHFWPFDGWTIPTGHSAIAEVYPALWSRAYPRAARTSDQQDAYAVAAWLQENARSGRLDDFLRGPDSELARHVAAYEGWILGVR